MICDNLAVNSEGHLTFAGYDTVALAEKYGTPLYLVDENKVREHIRCYKKAMADFLPEGSIPEFASKALSFKQIYRIVKEEGINVDLVSSGEIHTAYSAGFPMENTFFHGNNKTDWDIKFAIEKGVGYFVCDSADELEAINRIAAELGVKQKIFLRLSPGIDPHTHKKIATGSVDSKFGFPIETGDAELAVEKVLQMENLNLIGFHCHIGSQIFESAPFIEGAEVMLSFVSNIKEKTGYEASVVNLGGGLGVRYKESDPQIDYREKIAEIGTALKNTAERLNIKLPKILMEPGRSLVADAGMTLYTVGSVKEIKGYKNYVSVDGGMADNPRYALYEAPYSAEIANKMNDEKNYVATIAGRCCESGDVIQEGVSMVKPERGDILAVLTTGAYNYSMASNYNRLPKPPVVMLNDSGDYIAVKRETFEDVCGLDI